jgi:hypothetical protein
MKKPSTRWMPKAWSAWLWRAKELISDDAKEVSSAVFN